MMRRIDLLPSSYAEKRRERRNIGLVMLAGFAVLALLAFYWVMLGTQIKDAEQELEAVNRENLALQQRITQLQNFQALEDEVTAKRNALTMVLGSDVDWPALLTELALVTPNDVWLTELNASRAGAEGETPAMTEPAEVRISKTAPAGRVTFQGRALSMPAVAKWMLRLQDVRGVTATYLDNATEEEIEERVLVGFSSSVELTNKALSERFTGTGDTP